MSLFPGLEHGSAGPEKGGQQGLFRPPLDSMLPIPDVGLRSIACVTSVIKQPKAVFFSGVRALACDCCVGISCDIECPLSLTPFGLLDSDLARCVRDVRQSHRRSHTPLTNWPFTFQHDFTLYLSFFLSLSLTISFLCSQSMWVSPNSFLQVRCLHQSV